MKTTEEILAQVDGEIKEFDGKKGERREQVETRKELLEKLSNKATEKNLYIIVEKIDRRVALRIRPDGKLDISTERHADDTPKWKDQDQIELGKVLSGSGRFYGHLGETIQALLDGKARTYVTEVEMEW